MKTQYEKIAEIIAANTVAHNLRCIAAQLRLLDSKGADLIAHYLDPETRDREAPPLDPRGHWKNKGTHGFS